MKTFDKVILVGLVTVCPMCTVNANTVNSVKDGTVEQTLFASVSSFRIPSTAKANDDPLKYKRDKGNDSNHGTPRMPVDYSYLPITWVEDGVLYFQGTTSIPSMSMSIKDEVGTEVLNTTVNIQQGVTTSVNVSTLSSGTYTLYIIVNNITFFAEFDL